MKLIKISFLFFLLLNSINIQCLYSQDSLGYYSNKALHPQRYSDLENSYKYFKNLYQNSQTDRHLEKSAYYLYYLASIEFKKGNYIKSEQHITKTIILLDKLPDSKFTAQTRNSFYILMGLNYIEQKNDTKASEFYEIALKNAKNPQDSAKVYNNIALIYKKLGAFDKARSELKKAFALIPKIQDTLTVALITDNLGIVEFELNNSNGLELIEEALKLRRSIKDTSTLYTSYSHLADYYYKKNDELISKQYALKAYELAYNIGTPSYKQDALGLLTRLSDDDYARRYKKINDSIIKAEKQSDNEFALMKYDTSEANRKALEAELENERLENSQLLTILLLIFIALTSLLIYFFLKAKHKKEKLKQVLVTESKISKQVHDEVANNVFQVLIKYENDIFDHTELKSELNQLYHKARDISNKYSAVDTDETYNDSLESLIESYQDLNTNIVIKGLNEINWHLFSDVQKDAIYKIIQELLINMKKHSKASLVLVTFEGGKNSLTIKYSDNGIGTDLVKHTGLKSTENRIHTIGGTITFDTKPDNGFKVKIVL